MRLNRKILGLFALALGCLTLAAAPDDRGAGIDSSGEGYINFSFDQVDVRAFVKLIGQNTGKKFVVADDVTGKITIVSPRVSRKQAYSLFVSILESVGCSVVEEEGVCRVVLLGPRTSVIAPVVGVDEKFEGKGVITKIFHLQHVAARELKKVVDSMVRGGKTGAVGAIDQTNHLVITDTVATIRRIEKLVTQIDRAGLSRGMEIVPLKYASADELADQLNRAMAETATRGSALKQRLAPARGVLGDNRRAVVVAALHSNSVILVGTNTQILSFKSMIEKMDIDMPPGRGRLNAIFLKYISAEDAAKSLNALLKGKTAGKGASIQIQKRAIAIEASVVNNALLVDATPGNFETVKKLIEQIDQAPRQVHISVLIVEQSMGNALNAGVEMQSFETPEAQGESVFQGRFGVNEGGTLMNAVQEGLFPGGLTVGLAYGTRTDTSGNVVSSYPIALNINAIRQDSRFEIISETSLEAQDNKEATLSIVNQIPILKSIIQGGSGASRDVIQNIERLDVGVKLKLKPQIIPNGEVKMELNPSIEAVIDPGPAGTPFTPTIARREVSTTVIVPDGRMIVIAGLTRTDETKIVRRVPYLGAIPLIGALFRHTVDEKKKTNLLIFVTPRIVRQMDDADRIRRDWEEKTGLNPHAD